MNILHYSFFLLVSFTFMFYFIHTTVRIRKKHYRKNIKTDSASIQSSPDVKAAHARLRSMAKMPSETVQTSYGKSLKCSKIFIDIGANIGLHSRFIFESEHYPAKRIMDYSRSSKNRWYYRMGVNLRQLYQVFNQTLGPPSSRRNRDSGICVFGLEANPQRCERLKKLQKTYRNMGWYLNYSCPIAAYKNANGVNIYVDKTSDRDNNDWGASIHDWNKKDKRKSIKVPSVDLAQYVKFILNDHSPDFTMMKLDIEGAEYDVLPGLDKNGSLCSSNINGLDYMTIEYHPWVTADRNWRSRHYEIKSKKCDIPTKILELDSEAYYRDGVAFPKP